jgi:hypothetical protein
MHRESREHQAKVIVARMGLNPQYSLPKIHLPMAKFSVSIGSDPGSVGS